MPLEVYTTDDFYESELIQLSNYYIADTSPVIRSSSTMGEDLQPSTQECEGCLSTESPASEELAVQESSET